MARLLALRHAQSAWNVLGRWQGWSDPPLSEAGEADARRAGRSMAPLGRILASDLTRARRTAELIAGAWGLAEVATFPELRERDVGGLAGLTAGEVELRFPEFRASGVAPPGWESDEEVLARVLARLVDLETGAEPILVVTHGGVIRALTEYCGGPVGSAVSHNLSGRWFELSDGSLHLGEVFEGPPRDVAAG